MSAVINAIDASVLSSAETDELFSGLVMLGCALVCAGIVYMNRSGKHD